MGIKCEQESGMGNRLFPRLFNVQVSKNKKIVKIAWLFGRTCTRYHRKIWETRYKNCSCLCEARLHMGRGAKEVTDGVVLCISKNEDALLRRWIDEPVWQGPILTNSNEDVWVCKSEDGTTWENCECPGHGPSIFWLKYMEKWVQRRGLLSRVVCFVPYSDGDWMADILK